MSVITNTFTTYDAEGIREDLTDAIYNISPEETPFMSNIGRGKAKQTYHEWQVDALEAPSTSNQKLEGDDITSFPAITPTTRLGNYLNISRKEVIISDTEEEVDKAGRDSEMAYQMAKKSVELKRDMESAMLNNIAASAGSTSTPRVTGSILAFLKTNTNFGAGAGADPVYTSVPNATRTDGTLRTFTETIHKDVLQQVWASGGTVKVQMVPGTLKSTVSGFAGIATKTYQQTAAVKAAIIGAADVYVGEFDTFSIVPNRWMRSRDSLYLDPSYASVVFLRKFKTVNLSKTGDNEKKMIVVEWGLKVHNEAAHGLATDLQP